MNNSIIANQSYKEKVEEKKDLITFFTPTYNRANFLPRIEDCLLNQTCKGFVWIIVNDGSKDNTDEVALSIIKKERLPVKLISKENGGKHSAFKVALEACETTYFQCLDDDDIYFPGAVDFFLSKWLEIKKEKNDKIGAIRTLSKKPDGSYATNFEVIEGEEYDASTIETNFIMHRRQENWTCYETEKLRGVDLFKTYWMSKHHKFVIESIWQTRFARKYKCRYVNMAFREYRDDAPISLTRRECTRQNYIDMFLNYKVTIDEQYDLMNNDRKELFKVILRINFLRDYLGISFKEMFNNTYNWKLKIMYVLTYIPSLFSRQYYKFRNR